MASLATNAQWGNAPVISASFSYEHRRSVSDMQYRISITINPLTSSGSYFGYPIYAQITLAGSVVASTTLKAASPSTWSSAITYTSGWFTVANKTSGTTALAIRLYSGLSRNILKSLVWRGRGIPPINLDIPPQR